MIKFRAALLVVVLSLSAPSIAGVISLDYLASGDGLITRDTTHSLDWLDVAATVGVSSTTALSQYSGDGFRLATAAEVVSLYVGAGVDEVLDFANNTPVAVVGSNTSLHNVTSAIGQAAVFNLRNLLGWTPSAFGGNSWIHGYLADADNDGLSYLARTRVNGSNYAAHIQTNGDSWLSTTSHTQIGSFLVRNASVPEPSSLILLSLALGGLGFRRRRKH